MVLRPNTPQYHHVCSQRTCCGTSGSCSGRRCRFLACGAATCWHGQRRGACCSRWRCCRSCAITAVPPGESDLLARAKCRHAGEHGGLHPGLARRDLLSGCAPPLTAAEPRVGTPLMVTQAIEAEDGGKFHEDQWERDGHGGGGRSRVLQVRHSCITAPSHCHHDKGHTPMTAPYLHRTPSDSRRQG